MNKVNEQHIWIKIVSADDKTSRVAVLEEAASKLWKPDDPDLDTPHNSFGPRVTEALRKLNVTFRAVDRATPSATPGSAPRPPGVYAGVSLLSAWWQLNPHHAGDQDKPYRFVLKPFIGTRQEASAWMDTDGKQWIEDALTYMLLTIESAMP
jgi:hypothetical protein